MRPAQPRSLGGQVHQGDLFDPLPDSLRGRVDVLVANAPHVPTSEITLLPSETRDHEPWVFLNGGSDGLGVVRRVAAQARPWLVPGGHLLVQTHPDQVAEALAAFAQGGLEAHAVVDEDDRTSVIVGRRSVLAGRSASTTPYTIRARPTGEHRANHQMRG